VAAKTRGSWDSEIEIYMEPGKPPVKSKGLEVARMIGGFWILSEMKSEIAGAPFTGIMMLGYDPEKKKW